MKRSLYKVQVIDLEKNRVPWSSVVAFAPADVEAFVRSENRNMDGSPQISDVGDIVEVAEIPVTVPVVPLDSGRMRACYANARIIDFVEGRGDGQIKEE